MVEYKLCEVCGCNQIELHHVLYKSQVKIMSNIEINFKFLCPEHHRGNHGPHMNREIDLKYKLELQGKLENLFQDKEYWTEKEIKEKLNCSNNEVRNITKRLMIHKEGYKKLDLVLRLMGNRLYAK